MKGKTMEKYVNTQQLERHLRGKHRSEPGCTWYLARYDDGTYRCSHRPPRSYDYIARIFLSVDNERFAERVRSMWIERPKVLKRRRPVIRELRRAIDSLADAMESCELIRLEDNVRHEVESKLSAARETLRAKYNAKVLEAVKEAMGKGGRY